MRCATPDCFKPSEFVWLGFSLCDACHTWAFSMPDAYSFDPTTLIHLLWILGREDYPEDLDWEAAIEWAHTEWKAG